MISLFRFNYNSKLNLYSLNSNMVCHFMHNIPLILIHYGKYRYDDKNRHYCSGRTKQNNKILSIT